MQNSIIIMYMYKLTYTAFEETRCMLSDVGVVVMARLRGGGKMRGPNDFLAGEPEI